MATSNLKPRAPAARAKLDQAEQVLAELEIETASFALEAAEGKSGAEKLLAGHRSKIELAERNVAELKRAVALAERLDREAGANSAAAMRREQLDAFKQPMAIRTQAMGSMLDALATFTKAYAEFAEATLAAQSSVPSGCNIPILAMGPLGAFGPVFGDAERLLAAELFRIAPSRKDGIGTFRTPFARMPLATSNDHGALPPALAEFTAANSQIIADIEKQIAALDSNALAKAKDAA